jgi:hypothetical protein
LFVILQVPNRVFQDISYISSCAFLPFYCSPELPQTDGVECDVIGSFIGSGLAQATYSDTIGPEFAVLFDIFDLSVIDALFLRHNKPLTELVPGTDARRISSDKACQWVR